MVLVVPWKGCYLVLSWPTTFNLIFFFFHSSWLNEKENRFLHSVKQGGWRNSPSGTLHFDSSAHPCQNMLIEGKKNSNMSLRHNLIKWVYCDLVFHISAHQLAYNVPYCLLLCTAWQTIQFSYAQLCSKHPSAGCLNTMEAAIMLAYLVFMSIQSVSLHRGILYLLCRCLWSHLF